MDFVPMVKKEISVKQPSQIANNACVAPPPLPSPDTNYKHRGLHEMNRQQIRGFSGVPTWTDMWDNLFDGGYGYDVTIRTEDGGVIFAHTNVLSMASPVLRGMLKQANVIRRKRSISIYGVPHDAVRVFIRFLYSSRYEKEDMEELALHLLVLSHAYVVPQLKRICEQQLEHSFLTLENVIDVFQLALLCDAPRLSLIIYRMILRNFDTVFASEGWKAMKKSHPVLEKKILESLADEEHMQKKRVQKSEERKIYIQLYEAMEALVHICRDGCRTIGPYDKDFKVGQKPCNFAACKALELLVRHFASCKSRAAGGCIQCKRMWQLLELHSHLCPDSSSCRVPLCRNFKEKMMKQSKKDEIKWKMLVKRILRVKKIGGGPFFLSSNSIST